MTKSRIDQALERHADSSAVAAVELSRRELKRKRDRARGDAAKAAAAAREEAALRESSRHSRDDVTADAATQLSWRDDATADAHRAAYDADPAAPACVCRACTARAQQTLRDLLDD